jgi:hypothetical protein
MSAILLRVIIYAAIAAFVYYGVRRLWRDVTGQSRAKDRTKPQRDIRERARPDVIELKRGADGVYRPGGDTERR